jgi:SAM-dependent methyltransferase
MATTLKEQVREYWEAEPCESRTGRSSDRSQWFAEIDGYRYEKSPFIPAFAKFEEGRGKRVLEVGLGSSSDFIRWARAGATLYGRDLTRAAVSLAGERLAMENLSADVSVGDVEKLEFTDGFFDLVYCYGVLELTPDTEAAVREIHRVLKPGGVARVMIYNLSGLSVFGVWLVFGLLRGRPMLSRRQLMAVYNESPGTKLHTVSEAKQLFAQFQRAEIQTVLDSGDTLQFSVSSRYARNPALRAAFLLSPILRPLLGHQSRFGTTMLVEAVK